MASDSENYPSRSTEELRRRRAARKTVPRHTSIGKKQHELNSRFHSQLNLALPLEPPPTPPVAEVVSARPISEVVEEQCPPEHRIIVGIDYGTSHSGVSFVDSTKDSVSQITVINNWPGPARIGDGQWKTLSRIAYASENPGLEADQIGYEVLPKMKAYSWTKLLLDQHVALTDYDDPDLKKADYGMLELPVGKSAEDVAADYLKLILEYALNHLTKVFSADVVDSSPMDFFFTVPAIWSDAARASTLKAAKRAGFARRSKDTISLISEPEAAGIASLKHLTYKGSTVQISAGDGVMVVDCGGGTVDVTSYEIMAISPSLDFQELVVGEGGKCGASYIDRQFLVWMTEMFGPAFQRLGPAKIGLGSRFMKDFESVKRDFDEHRISQLYELQLVMDVQTCTYYNAEENVLCFTGRELQSFFAPVIAKIINLIEEQITSSQKRRNGRKINRLVLAGGFGDSPYLNSILRKWTNLRNIRLICPEHPQAAILKGAALRGLERLTPSARLLRRHYGFGGTGGLFVEGVDPESQSFIDAWDGSKRCSEVDWQISKGQSIDDTTCVSSRVHMVVYPKEDQGSFGGYDQKLPLYTCAQDKCPKYEISPGVVMVGHIRYRIPHEAISGCPSRLDEDGDTIMRIPLTVEVRLASAEGVLKFRVLKDKVEVGSAQIVYVTH